MRRFAIKMVNPEVLRPYSTLRMGALPPLSAAEVEADPRQAAQGYIKCIEFLKNRWDAENSHHSDDRSDQLRVFVPPEYGFAKPEEPLSAIALQIFKGVLFDYMKKQEPGSAICISGAVKLGTTTLDGRETVSNETTLIQSGMGQELIVQRKISESAAYWPDEFALRPGGEFEKIYFSHQTNPLSASIAACSDLYLPQEKKPNFVISPAHGSPMKNNFEFDGYNDATLILVNDGKYPKNSGYWRANNERAESLSEQAETMEVPGVRGKVLSLPPIVLQNNLGR